MISAEALEAEIGERFTWERCWMWSMPLTQPEKYSCYALFCFRAATSSLWHLAVIRGKPWIPHISTVNSTLTLDPKPNSHTARYSKATAQGPGQCSDSGWMHEAYSHFLSPTSAMLMTEWQVVFSLCISVLQLFPFLHSHSLFPRLCRCVGGNIWGRIKATDVKRSRIAQLCTECGTLYIVNVIWKIVYSISVWLFPLMSIVHRKVVWFKNDRAAAVGQFLWVSSVLQVWI